MHKQLISVDSTRNALNAALMNQESVDLSWIQPPPTNDGWTLASDALIFITRMVRELKPRHILEFGSGLSTRVLTRACSELQLPCYITSIDNDPEFSKLAVQELERQVTKKCHVKFQVSPLIARDCGGKTLPFYHVRPKRFASKRPVDMVLIDGPPNVLGGREGMLYQAMEYSKPGTILFLDDADRKEEKEILKRWKDNFKDAIEVKILPSFVKGMASIIIHSPVSKSEIWKHRLSLCLQDIEALIPKDENFILIDWTCSEIGLFTKRKPIYFLERNGEYYGPPEDDNTAIIEVNELRKSDASFLVFCWPAFWWLEYYADFYKYLQSHFQCILNNDLLVVFDLRVIIDPDQNRDKNE